VEKKPLYHFYPGQNILSLGSYGCNMRCAFCQNYHISQNIPENIHRRKIPERIADDLISSENNIGIAFTYNEPIISIEFMRDVAAMAKDAGLFTVMVSNGYINNEPLSEIINFIDAFNIDLKAFNGVFYKKLTGAEIGPVRDSLKQISKAGRHLEITTLIIPGKNDDKHEMELQSEWIANELGKDIPLHLSRYFPTYKMDDPATPQDTLMGLFETASRNLSYVYMGNTNYDSGQNTVCPNCGTVVTKRSGYKTQLMNLDKGGRCTGCRNLIYKNFTF
jgi:pyruvate formate lyase activating enzyme